MKVGDAAIAQVLDQVLLAANRRSRHNFLGDIRLQAWLLRDRTAEPRAEEHGLHVVGGLEKLELYLRGCEWIGRFEAYAAAPFRLQVNRRDHEARPRVGNDAVTVPTVDGIEGDVELQVGPIEAGVGAHEDAGQRAGTGERPLPPERVFDACLDFLHRRTREVIERDGLVRFPGDERVEVVVQVGADREIAIDVDAYLPEMLAGPDPRQHQQLRRAIDATRDHDLAAAARSLQPLRRAELDTDRTLVLD